MNWVRKWVNFPTQFMLQISCVLGTISFVLLEWENKEPTMCIWICCISDVFLCGLMMVYIIGHSDVEKENGK